MAWLHWGVVTSCSGRRDPKVSASRSPIQPDPVLQAGRRHRPERTSLHDLLFLSFNMQMGPCAQKERQ